MIDTMSCRPRRTGSGDVHRFDKGAVVTGSRATRAVALNPTALALWELCDGDTTVAEMVDAVCELFAIGSEQARGDVESALAQMQAAGVIV